MQRIDKRRNYHPVSKRGYLMNVKSSHPFHSAYIDREWYRKELMKDFTIKRKPYLKAVKRKFSCTSTRKNLQSKKWRM